MAQEKVVYGLLGLGAGLGASAVVHRDTIAELRKINAKLDVPLSSVSESIRTELSDVKNQLEKINAKFNVPLSGLQETIRKIIREELGEEALKSFPKYVAITFDDGLANTQYNNIKSIISKYKIPVTLFPTADLTGQGVRNTYGEPAIVEPDQQYKLKELYDTGLVEIGSHSVNHPRLPNLSAEEIEFELSKSKEILESIINDKVVSFAYPFGEYNAMVLNIVKRYYKYARATNLYLSDEYPLRPSSRYKIMITDMFNELRVPYLPAVFLLHNEPLSYIEPRIEASIMAGAEFLKFSEFVEKVQKLPRLGIKVNYQFARVNITSTTLLNFGSFEGELEAIILSNNPASAIQTWSGAPSAYAYAPEYGGIPTSPSTWENNVSFQVINDLGGTDIWEIQKYDTTSNLYIARTKKPLPGKNGIAIRLLPASGASMAIKVMITFYI